MNFLHSYNLNPDSRFDQLTLINTFLTFAERRLCDVRGDPQPEPPGAGHGQHHHVRPGAPPQEVQGEERLRLRPLLHQRLTPLTTVTQEQEAKEHLSSACFKTLLLLMLFRAFLWCGGALHMEVMGA